MQSSEYSLESKFTECSRFWITQLLFNFHKFEHRKSYNMLEL